jgi:O-antigen ligase/polysaccharide polymerase Wzy-like membrane protein
MAVVAVSVLVGLVSAGLASGRLGLLPPELKSSPIGVAAAKTHALVDSAPPSTVQRRALKPDFDTLIKHAELLGRVMVSPPVLDRMAVRAGLPRGSVGGSARTTTSVPEALLEPGSEQRAAEISRSNLRHGVEVQARPTASVIDIYTRAPSAAEALRLANVAVPSLRDYLRDLAAEQGVSREEIVSVRQIGDARGSAVSAQAPVAVGLLAFVVGFVLSCGALLLLLRLGRDRIPARPGRPAGASERREGEDDWPHTARILPWLLAGFVAIVWLVPFNAIELDASLPIDVTLDRIALPLVVVAWIVALAAGGSAAPRFRFTWIHAAIGLFVAFAFLSVLLNAGYLNQTLELDLSFKKLPLLVSFVSVFVLAATGLRRTEARAFLNYTLVLAVITAVGIVVEYRFKQNLFYDWSDKLLPGAFAVAEIDPAEVDGIGRRIVRGPGEGPLEAVAMLALALPIALVGLMQSKEWRWRIVYALAACLLVAATFATYRKSAVLAPVAAVLTLAYFRRRELLKLAPLGLVVVVIVTVLSPGAVGSTVDQFIRPDRLAVPTVSDRASDYDAVRPDLWTHLAFGRGWGSYNHETYRILDSEILHRTLEMGVLGLVAFLLMVLTVILSARSTIAERDPRWAPVALMGAAASAAFLTLSALFDVLSFPHPTYIFLYTAGLVAVVVAQRGPEPIARAASAEPVYTGRGRWGALSQPLDRRGISATPAHQIPNSAMATPGPRSGLGSRTTAFERTGPMASADRP